MYKLIRNSGMPKFLKILINILLTLTCVYWIGYFTYKILDTIRKVLHWTTETRNWWTFLVSFLILGVGILLSAQYIFDLDPFGCFSEWIINKINEIRNSIANIIVGVK